MPAKEGEVRGSTNWQVQQVFAGVNQIGQSKHAGKQNIRFQLNVEGKAATWHDLGKRMGVYSYNTADAYRDVWRALLGHAKAEYGVKDIEKLSGEQVGTYFESKIDQGVAHATFMQYASAIEKLETALNRYAENHNTNREYSFTLELEEARHEAHLELDRFEGSRAYANPEKLINAIRDSRHNLAACIQCEVGARVHETSLIKSDQLRGFREDKITGRVKGYAAIKGKGGKPNEIGLSQETFQRLESHIGNNGEFRVDKDKYRSDLRAASAETEQKYTGSHGLRWSYAQKRFMEMQRHGLTYEQALSLVSDEMGHERSDITEHYLK